MKNRKTCIFVIGEPQVGKSSVIRALTGCGRNISVKTLISPNNNQIKTLIAVSSPQEMSNNPIPPEGFIKELEDRLKKRKWYNPYEMIICALQIKLNRDNSFDKYIEEAQSKGFTIKVAVIRETDVDNEKRININRVNQVTHFCGENGIEVMPLNLTNGYYREAGRIRDFYPD